jgi:GH24 family phage-related lysozyme (muramidase)
VRQRKLRAVGAIIVVAVVCAAGLVGAARSQVAAPVRSGPPFMLSSDIRMLVKYYEGIRLNSAGDRACLYNDGETGCWDLTSTGKGNCTIGWGHLVNKGPCDAAAEMKYGDGITFDDAEKLLTQDIKVNALDPLDDCVKVPLSEGELRALVSFLFNEGPGPAQAVNAHYLKNKKTGQRTFKPCVPGPVARLLNDGGYDQLPAKLLRYDRKSKPLQHRRQQEVYDATGGVQGEARPAKWYITTGVRSIGGAVGTVRVNGKVCATNETGLRKRTCGPFQINQPVTIVASTSDPKSHFVRWENTTNARDLCAGQGASCSVQVRDQLVRAIAVFERGKAGSNPKPPPTKTTPTTPTTPTTTPKCTKDNLDSPPPAGCYRVTVRVIPSPLPSDPGNEGMGDGVGTATIQPGGQTLPCLNPANAGACITHVDVAAGTSATVTEQPGSLTGDPSSPPDSAFEMYGGACSGSGTCSFTPTNSSATVNVYFVPATAKLTIQAAGDGGEANMTVDGISGGAVDGISPLGPVYCGPEATMALPCSVLVRIENYAQVEADDPGDDTTVSFSENCTRSGQGPDFCDIFMTSDQTVTATYGG